MFISRHVLDVTLRRRLKFISAVLLTVSVMLAQMSSVLAADGDLDPTFDGDGIATTPIGQANGVAVQADGKIVVVGLNISIPQPFVVARYNTNGSLDTTFGINGIVTTQIGNLIDVALDVAIQTNGKIVVVGSSANRSNRDFAVVRYNSNGSLDTTFDTDGIVTTSIGNYDDIANGVAIQSDGKIVVAGNSINGAYYDFSATRYNTDGSLDTAFDLDGKVITLIGIYDDVANGVAIQSDGRIVLAGQSLIGLGLSTDFAVVRYNTNGSLDTTFDTDGIVTTPIRSSNDIAKGIAIQPDGKIVVAGTSELAYYNDFAVARYNSNGSLDMTFDNDGKVTTPIGSFSDDATGMAIQPNGKIVVAGYSTQSSSADFAAVRYNADGSLDTTFSNDGKVTTHIGNSIVRANGIAIQPDGNIVVVGYGPNIVVVRYQSTPVTTRKTLDFNGDGIADFAIITNNFDQAMSYAESNKSGISTPKQINQRFKAGIPYSFQPGKAKTIEALTGQEDYAWSIRLSTGGPPFYVPWGNANDFFVPGQFTADNRTDIAVWRPSTQQFHILTSESIYNPAMSLTTPAIGGMFSDPTVIGDYTGDGIDDPCVFTGTQWIYLPNNGDGTFGDAVTVNFGQLGDVPSPGDYDGDGINDFGVAHPDPNNPYLLLFVIGFNDGSVKIDRQGRFGESDDMIVPGDYDGLGSTDVAITDVTNFPYIYWIFASSETGFVFGNAWGDNSIGYQSQGDYDGDNKDDITVWHSEPSGIFYVRRTTDLIMGIQTWGGSTDYPAANYQSH